MRSNLTPGGSSVGTLTARGLRFLVVFLAISSTSLKTPALQLPITPTRRQRARLGALDRNYFMRLTIYAHLHAGAAVTIVHVGFDPLLGTKLGPVALGLIATLHADDPVGIAIV